MPSRIQLSRAKGWRKPEGAIVVARPSRWGNPWRVGDQVAVSVSGETPCPTVGSYGEDDWRMFEFHRDVRITPTMAVELYRQDLLGSLADEDAYYDELRAALRDLRGHDLACWCPLDEPCHADVLLELAPLTLGTIIAMADRRYERTWAWVR